MMKKVIVAQGLASMSIPQKIESTRFKINSLTGNAYFPTPTPTIPVLTANVNALETAHLAARGGGEDETAAMHAKEAALDLSLKLLAAYVENVANANPANAEAIVLSAGMNIKKQNPPRPNGFRVKLGKNSGEADLKTDSDPRATFAFQLTITPGDVSSWKEVHSSTHSHCIITGLTPGERYNFHVAKTDKDGQGPWSNVLSLIIV